MSVICQDSAGLFVKAGGYIARPGDVGGYSHAFDMSDGGLKKGDRVKASHMTGAPIVKLRLEGGKVLHWYTGDGFTGWTNDVA